MQADRLIAWDAELRAVHARLREALAVARGAVDGVLARPGADDGVGAGSAVGIGTDGAAAGADDPAGTGADGAAAGALAAASRDLLLYCTGFCAALDGHHRSEDSGLFPALSAEYPELKPVIDKLMQDHSMLSYLLVQFRGAVDSGADAVVLDRHLEGIAAIMESHFRFEERELLVPLAGMRLGATPGEMLGPLA